MSSLLCVDSKNLIACPKQTILSFSFASCKNVCTCSRPGCLVIVFFNSEFSFVLPLFLRYRLWLLILLPYCQCPLGLSFLGLSSLDMNLLRLRFLSLCQQTLGNLALFWPFSVLFCHRFLHHHADYYRCFYFTPHLLCSCLLYAISFAGSSLILFHFPDIILWKFFWSFPITLQSFSLRERWYLLLGDFAPVFVPAFVPALYLPWSQLLLLLYNTVCVCW